MPDIKNEGRIDQARGRIRSAWADLTDNDIEQVKGDIERLVGTIKEKTGESADAIRARLNELMGEAGDRDDH